MVHPDVCNNFINRPANSYRPLACKPIVVTSKEIPFTGQQNREFYFFLTKANTIRESATLDLLFPHPEWLKRAVQNQ